MPKPFVEVVGGSASDFTYPLISELVNSEFEISAVRFGEGQYGAYAVVTVKDGGVYRTSSLVLLKQLEKIRDYIKETKDTVIVTLRKIGRYYTFE